MTSHAILLRIAGTMALAASCAGCWATEGQLRQRVAADFDCPPDKLVVKDVGDGLQEVSGCDQKGRYVYSPRAKEWLRESEAGGKVITLPR